MKKNITWWQSLIVAAILLVVSNLFPDNVFAMAAGVVGDICLIIGVIYGIVALVKHFQKK